MSDTSTKEIRDGFRPKWIDDAHAQATRDRLSCCLKFNYHDGIPKEDGLKIELAAKKVLTDLNNDD